MMRQHKRRPAAVVELFPAKPRALNWYEDPLTVLQLGRWLEERGDLSPLPSDWETLFEKPYHFESLWSEYQRSLLTGPDDDGPRAA